MAFRNLFIFSILPILIGAFLLLAASQAASVGRASFSTDAGKSSVTFDFGQTGDYQIDVCKNTSFDLYKRYNIDSRKIYRIKGLKENSRRYVRARRCGKIFGAIPFHSEWTSAKAVYTKRDVSDINDPGWHELLAGIYDRKEVIRLKHPIIITDTAKKQDASNGESYYRAFYNVFHSHYDQAADAVEDFKLIQDKTHSKVAGIRVTKYADNYTAEKAMDMKIYETRAAALAERASHIGTDRGKAVFVNNELCRLCRYDYDGLRYSVPESRHHSKEAVLVDGLAVCDGYSYCYKDILDRLGIPCECEVGKEHMWNVVKVGGKWLVVDVTWNDTSGTSKWLLTTTHEED